MKHSIISVGLIIIMIAACQGLWTAQPQAPAGKASMPAVKDMPVRTAMPDPLIMEDGHKIKTAKQWKKRRQQMKQILEDYAIGHMPPPPGNVKGLELQSKTLMEGKVTFRLVRLTFGPSEKLGFDIAVFIPAQTGAIKPPYPAIIQPSFSPTPGVTPPAAPSTTAANPQGAGGRVVRAVTPEDAVKQYEEPLRRGYAIITYNYQQCGADNRNFLQSGFFPAYPDYDWGDLAAWAWGMSRCVDYLEGQPFADKSRIIGIGHSRLGKAALIAGAFDDRFALTAPAGSGCGGTGAYRFNGKDRGGKEGLEEATKSFPQWFGPRLVEFSGQVEKLPFDQHWFIALIAPRLFIAADGLDDSATNGNALVQSYLAARPVFAFLRVADHLGINFRPGRHLLAPEDWQAILDFSDLHLSNMEVKRRFDLLPPAEQLH